MNYEQTRNSLIDFGISADRLPEEFQPRIDLSRADLRWADLSRADLSEADLRWADLSRADLSRADLSRADLSGADLSGADLRWADLSRADLSGADLRWADLRWAIGLPDPIDWLMENFSRARDGLVVYKAIGSTEYSPPPHWRIEEGAYLTESVDPDRQETCSRGVNFGTIGFISEHYAPDVGREVWKCLIEDDDLPGVVVPYATDGKARCGRLKLLRPLTEDEFYGLVAELEGE